MREGGRVALVVKGPPACWIQLNDVYKNTKMHQHTSGSDLFLMKDDMKGGGHTLPSARE